MGRTIRNHWIQNPNKKYGLLLVKDDHRYSVCSCYRCLAKSEYNKFERKRRRKKEKAELLKVLSSNS